MAEKCFPTLQELRGFGIDADVWRKFINGEIDEVNMNRNGVDVATLLTWKARVIEIARQAANMQTHLTKAEMEATGPQPKGTVAQVTNDPDAANNGYWVSDGSQWVWSGVQPVTHEYLEEKIEETQGVANEAIDTARDAAITAAQRAGNGRYPLSSWGETSRDAEVDDSGSVAGGNDVLNDHEARISGLEAGEGGNVIRGHISYGQSNARGAGSPVPSALTSTAVYVSQAFMPGGPGMNVALGTGASGTYEPINPNDFQSFVPLRSTQLSAGNSTTLLEGIGWAQARWEESIGRLTARLYWTAAQGGVSLAARSPGTVPYSNMLAGLNRSVAIAQGQGKTYVIDAVSTADGEADTVTPDFDQRLIEMYAEQLTADIKQITSQTFDPYIIMTQPSSFLRYTQGVLGIYRAARKYPRMFLATAGYHLPYWTDLLHYSGVGHLMNGEYHFRVLQALRAGRSWKPVMPKYIKWDGGTGVDVWFHVPEPPIVLDPLAPHHGDFGFQISAGGAMQTIASIEQMGPDHLHFETAVPLGSDRALLYAMRGYTSQPRTEGDGPMGALRDSCDAPSIFDPNHTLWNWGVHFSEAF